MSGRASCSGSSWAAAPRPRDPRPEARGSCTSFPRLRGDGAPVAAGEPATDDLDDIPAELLAILGEADDEPDEAAARHTDNKLQTALRARRAQSAPARIPSVRPASRSRNRGSTSSISPSGCSAWYESESSSTERRAPLILIPVQLARSGVRENFKLKWTGDDIEANLSLEVKLKQEFGVRLPEMPAEEDLDVEDYLSRVEKAVRRTGPVGGRSERGPPELLLLQQAAHLQGPGCGDLAGRKPAGRPPAGAAALRRRRIRAGAARHRRGRAHRRCRGGGGSPSGDGRGQLADARGPGRDPGPQPGDPGTSGHREVADHHQPDRRGAGRAAERSSSWRRRWPPWRS